MEDSGVTDHPQMNNYPTSTSSEGRIYLIRDQKVLLDQDVAALYEVDIKDVLRAVSRNKERFPVDFMFRLTPEEFEELKEKEPDNVHFSRHTSTPRAFTQAGVVMLAQLLKSARASLVNLTSIREFVRLREYCSGSTELAQRFEQMRSQYDQQFKTVFQTLKRLEDRTKPPVERQVGFKFR